MERMAQLEALSFEWTAQAAAKKRPAAVVQARPRTKEPAAKSSAKRPKAAALADAAAGCLPGARVARLFGDDRWHNGTVLEAPWPPEHRWGRWCRVRFSGLVIS